ncbi:hypothetical protein PYW08_005355 [Mythimna loreyi]|uniref:Uncharacterized protein n=1 Tax=Mythimna loreyi TaxID=667449 RepID=A0ACC2QGS4_9NEOP|nr:hypothetical protein PYW08_005355 [Mythimna loreyi]
MALENLRNLLRKIASQNKYDNPEINIDEISSGGANYTSKLYTVVIKAQNKEDLHLFAKVAATGEAFRRDIPINAFKTEDFAYVKLAKTYATLEEENGVPEEHRLHFAKFYGSDPTEYQEILVIENLMANGYGPHDRFNTVDWEYASATVADLAKMHALSFAFSKHYPEEFEKALEELHFDFNNFGGLDIMLKRSTDLALDNVKPENKEVLKKFLQDQKNPFEMYVPIRSKVIVHADFRGNNLLHKVREDGKVEIKIVDLQTLQAGSPITDLLYFIFTGSDEEFRAKYFDKLIDHYYSELSAAMRRLNLNPDEIFPREDFDYEFKEKLPFGLTLAVFTLPVITVDTANAPEVNENLDISNFAIEKTSDLYAERLNGVVNDYVKWGILK